MRQTRVHLQTCQYWTFRTTVLTCKNYGFLSYDTSYRFLLLFLSPEGDKFKCTIFDLYRDTGFTKLDFSTKMCFSANTYSSWNRLNVWTYLGSIFLLNIINMFCESKNMKQLYQTYELRIESTQWSSVGVKES